MSSAAPCEVELDDLPLGPKLQPPHHRRWTYIAIVSVAACAVVSIVLAWSADHPSFPYDEVSMFQMSRLLIGDETPFVNGRGYFPGLAVLLAPIWWFTSNPETFYRAGSIISLAIGFITIWPLASLGRRFGLPGPQSVAAAAIVMTMPARTIQGDYLFSERLLVLLTILAALAAYRFVEKPTPLRAVQISLWLALGLFTHARFSPILLAAAIWFLMIAARHLTPALVGLASLAVGGYAAQWSGVRLNELLLDGPFRQDSNIGDILANLTPGLLARTALGQSWYQLIATFGLISIGSVALSVLVWRELRRWDIGGGTFILGTTAAAVATSMLRWADSDWLIDGNWVRLDVWIYGRYGDALTVLLAMLGLAFVLTSVARAHQLVSLAAAALLCLPVIVWLAPRVPTWGYVTPAHIPGILPFWPLLPEESWPRDLRITPSLTNENSVWIVASIFVLVSLMAMFALRRSPAVLAVGLLVVVVVASLGANPRSNRFQAVQEQDLAAIGALHDLEAEVGVVDVEFDTSCPREGWRTATSENYLGFYALPTVIGSGDASTGMPAADVVMSCGGWDRAEELQARALIGPPVFGTTLWVLPGPAQRAAEQAGLLAN